MRLMLVKTLSFLFLFNLFTSGSFAQDAAKYDAQMKRLSGMLRMKAKIMRIKEPLLYIGFQNSDASIKLDELAIERSFINKFSAIIVCNPQQDFEASQKFDATQYENFVPSTKKINSLLTQDHNYAFVLFGRITPSSTAGKVDVSAVLYNLKLDQVVAEYTLKCDI